MTLLKENLFVLTATDTSPIIDLPSFITATRDSGYKGLSPAIAEIVDNAIEANASRIDIYVKTECGNHQRDFNIVVCDDGTGMTPAVLRIALQFGGSTKFNSREGVGRYGMGLPNSSLSQARRLEVYTWTTQGSVWWTYLDVDEVTNGHIRQLPRPERNQLPSEFKPLNPNHGTIVVWSKCDRLSRKRTNTSVARLHTDLGRIFREFLWAGKILRINGEEVKPIDPLFMREGTHLLGAQPYGPPLSYEIRLPSNLNNDATSSVSVRFAELPVDKWRIFSNEEKRSYGITNGAGMSILRAGREIDYGWFFAGKKRRENYDDWWRCEIHFEPILDELFGITHTKQGIHPSELIVDLLSPDIERIAHQLNSRVRNTFISAKKNVGELRSEKKATQFDSRLEPPITSKYQFEKRKQHNPEAHARCRVEFPGLKYKIRLKKLESLSFFQTTIKRGTLVLDLNEEHPFCRKIYRPLVASQSEQTRIYRDKLELILLAFGRAEQTLTKRDKNRFLDKLRETWSNNLATFLT